MKLFAALLLLASAYASSGQATPASAPQSPVDPKLHADAVKFVEAAGTRKTIQDDLSHSLNEGVKAIKDKCPNCT